jgi:hypothetical protein
MSLPAPRPRPGESNGLCSNPPPGTPSNASSAGKDPAVGEKDPVVGEGRDPSVDDVALDFDFLERFLGFGAGVEEVV